MIIIIPTNRTVELTYLEPLIAAGCRFIVVNDSDRDFRVDHPAFRVVSWQDQDRMLGPNVSAIPRRNGACRSFGFYLAWKESDPDECIVALDDDCIVDDPKFAEGVNRVLGRCERTVVDSQSQHVNILNLYTGADGSSFPRGFPYEARNGHVDVFSGTREAVSDFNLGLWRGIFDVNAVDKAQGHGHDQPNARLAHESVLIPKGKLISVCSMNMQFRRKLLPVAYQLPMHVAVGPNMVIDRYGDIWGGFIMKVLMDLKGDTMTAGGPTIFHKKDGNLLRNAWQENVCHIVNHEFLRTLESWKVELGRHDSSYLDSMKQLAELVEASEETASPLLRAYFASLCGALRCWGRALS